MLTTHPHLVPMSRMRMSYTSSPTSAFMACSGTALAFMIDLCGELVVQYYGGHGF
jgi:hypothetical protein